LLTLLVDVVDAELLEAVVLEDLETKRRMRCASAIALEKRTDDRDSPIDIENTEESIVFPSRLHRDVDSVDDPLEESLV
jgi:hypothetical protein